MDIHPFDTAPFDEPTAMKRPYENFVRGWPHVVCVASFPIWSDHLSMMPEVSAWMPENVGFGWDYDDFFGFDDEKDAMMFKLR